MVRQGNIDNPPKTPLIPGFECSGIVEAVGGTTKSFEVSVSVNASPAAHCALPGNKAYAAHCLVQEIIQMDKLGGCGFGSGPASV